MLQNFDPGFIWLIIGLVFLICEIFIPGLIIAFFGVGALITAATTFFKLTPGIPAQLLVFSLSSVFLLIIVRRFVKKIFAGKTFENGEVTSFNLQIGKVVPVIELIEPGAIGGKVRYQGVQWQARSQEKIIPGESAVIVGCDNLTLIVEKYKVKKELEEEENQEKT